MPPQPSGDRPTSRHSVLQPSAPAAPRLRIEPAERLPGWLPHALLLHRQLQSPPPGAQSQPAQQDTTALPTHLCDHLVSWLQDLNEAAGSAVT